ncbi:hypothetical protein F4818DRAFT_221715 [Hypoxylon cercidicola]|nr:hypothetical protein F4818DRAFT_221715 [Hypoxylon cercidicola]
MASFKNTPTYSIDVVPKTEIEVLSQEISEDEAMYRIRAGNRVHYLTIPAHPDPVFDELTLCRPYLLIPKLPPFPSADWTKMELSRSAGGEVKSTISYAPLSQIQSSWHPRHIEVLSLKRISSHNARVKEVELDGRIVFAKVAIFEWWIPQVERETRVYEVIAENECPDKPPIAPAFLGHLTEQGRTIGFLMGKVEGSHASLVNLPECEAALRRLHGMGLVHGDANRYNFVVERSTGHVKMIDFEHAEAYDEEKARAELEELKAQLTEETGRGTTVVVVNGVEKELCAAPIPYVLPS